MVQSALSEDPYEIAPLVSVSPSSETSITTPTRRLQKGRRCTCSLSFMVCVVIAAIVLFSYLYVDKEAVVGLRHGSSSYIRDKTSGKENELSNNTEVATQNMPDKIAVNNTNQRGQSFPTNNGVTDTALPEFMNNTTDVSANKVVDGDKYIKKNDKMPIYDYNGKREKKELVIHVGPQKTGSTTLQTAWYSPQGLTKPLRLDNYRYSFINPHQGFFDCEVYNGAFHNCKASQRLQGTIKNAKEHGQNLLLSDENLDEKFAEALGEVINTDDWNVTVIVVYRRIHEWLVSWYNQINKSTNKDKNGNFLIDDHGHPYRREHIFWPDQGGIEIPSFSEWYRKFTQHFDHANLASYHRSISFMNAYKSLFDNVVVHNMHEEGDLVTNFMCHSVPKAIQCCDRLKEGALNIPRENASIDLDHDIIAVEARKRGLLRKTLKRKDVVSAVSNFIQQNNKILPRKCSNEVIDEVRKWLIDSEKVIFNDEWTIQTTKSLNETFELYLGNGKLCDVDVEQIFEDAEWIDFFESLDDRPTLILHIGPQKTGSSTLQNAWATPKELGDVLQQDHFRYARLTPGQGMFDCASPGGKKYSNCTASEKLKTIINSAVQKGQNLLLSDENLNENYIDALRSVIDERQFKVKVIVVYRRIHKWLYSWYDQLNKKTNKDKNGNFLQDKKGNYYSEEHKYWPEQGGEYIPSFGDWYKNYVNHVTSQEELLMEHPAIHFMNVYKPYYKDIKIFNMHQEGDLVTNFMCQMVSEASKACKVLRQGVDVPLENASVNLDYDILAVNAYEGGFVRKDITRPILVAAITFFVENTGISLARKCDEDMIAQIHGWLINSESFLFENEWDAKRKNEVEQDFYAYQANGKLCNLDLDAIFSDSEWLEFFDSLKQLDLAPLLPSSNSENAIDNLQNVEQEIGQSKPSSDQNESSRNQLVLHVGPQKTGSTTLQTAWSILLPILDQDEYNYKHVTPEQSDFDCKVNRWGGFTDCKGSDSLKSLIAKTKSEGRNLLLSDENLDERFAESLRNIIDDRQWQVTVVVTYRRIHEWLVSWYNQINKTTNLDSKGNILVNEKGNPYREEHKNWPDQGGIHIPNFSSWYLEFTQYWEPSELIEKHRSIEFYQLYNQLFDNVIVYDMHKGGDLVTNFMCDVVPKADHTCLMVQNHQVEIPKANPSIDLDYDILAVYAYDKGYVNKSLNRREVVSAVAEYVDENEKSIPRSCSPEVTKQIFDWLVDSEKLMFADGWSTKRYDDIKESFQAYFSKGLICDVDTEEALRDQDWVDFFQSLGDEE